MQANGWIVCLEETIAWERMRFPSDKLPAIPIIVIVPPAMSTVLTITQFNPPTPICANARDTFTCDSCGSQTLYSFPGLG
ncbi:hypothetical protein M422DRAFT_239101 [Sphaerobolus stellatus SS14]|nr:hypothetical protein M422DRAFT_239101 [Sphaerobolus stellatus SS14]